jgi:hypothetical protein
MSAPTNVATSAATVPDDHHESIWGKAIYKLRRDRAGMVGFAIVMAYFITASGVWLGNTLERCGGSQVVPYVE